MEFRELKTSLRGLGAAIGIAFLIVSPAWAHHGWSHYDAGTTLNLTGVISETSYSNPHGSIRLQVEGEKGKTWQVILAPPSRMINRGLSQEMLTPGTTATVVGYPHRENADEMRAERISIGGQTVELR